MSKHALPTLAAFAAAAALVPAAAQAAEVETALVSRASGFDGAPSESFSASPSVSQDGRYVAFASQGNALSDLDDNGVLNVFVRDRATGQTELISRGAGVPANDDSEEPRISPDGRFVLFLSLASNLSPFDDNGARDAFVYDRQTGTTVQASRLDGPNGAAFSQGVTSASMSADGTKVVFTSSNDDLSNIDDDTASNVYLRDLAAGTTELVSQDGGVGGDDDSREPVISGDGTDVAFTSSASNLAGGGAPGLEDVYVRNLVNDTTTLVSRPTGFNAVVGDGLSNRPAISHTGRHIAFQTAAGNLVDDDADGAGWRVLRRDTLTGFTALASRQTGANGAPNPSQAGTPAISANGTVVAFEALDQLDPAAQPGIINVYARDMAGNATTLISRATGPDGAGADVSTFGHAISADGATVAFASSASNLGEDGLGGIADVFVRGLPIEPIAPPQDLGDGDGGGGGGGGGGGVVQEPAAEPQPEPLPEQQPAPVVAPTVVAEPKVAAVAPKLRMRLVRLGAHKAKVRVSCLAGECRGVLKVKRPSGKGRALGRAAFQVAPAGSQVVTVRLKRRPASARLAQARRPKVRAIATVRPAGQPKTVVTRKLRLRR